MIGGLTPIMGFNAPENRSGKGLLMEALLAPACCRSWTTTAAPTRTEEWQKQIVASLKAGSLVAAFDNSAATVTCSLTVKKLAKG